MNLFLPACLSTFTSMVYFANTCGAKSGDKSWATMLACDEAMDLVFGTGADAVLDDADDVTHRPLSEPAVDVEVVAVLRLPQSSAAYATRFCVCLSVSTSTSLSRTFS